MFKYDKPLRFFLLWFFIFILIRLIGYFTTFPDKIFPKINLFITKAASRFSSLLPFSLGDVFYTILGIFLLIFFVKFLRRIKDKNWIKIRKMTSFFFIGFTFFTLIFYFFWGFNYYKTPVKENYNTEEMSLEELKHLAEFYLNKSIEIRELVKEGKDGVFEFQLSDEELQYEISVSASELMRFKELRLNPPAQPNLKKSLYSTVFSYLGVLGYYNPFTSEAQFNSKMPDTKRLFTQFHEVAHQWGFAPESEANFVGYLIGIKSENKEFNYVSNYKALRSLLNKIVWEDPQFVESMLNHYSPKMKMDREYELEIQRKYRHSADDAFSMLNEAYLQLNNQNGLESYGQFVELLVGFHRKYNPLKEL